MKLTWRLFAVLALVSLALNWVSPASAEPEMAGEDSAALAQRLLELVNQERLAAGLSALQWNDTLAADAAAYAQDMAARGYFGHYSPEGASPYDRAWEAGYPPFDWGVYVGENLAMGYTNPEAVVQGWMVSESHRSNLLLPGYAEAGAAVAIMPDGRKVWVQEFGSRPGTGSPW